MESDYLLSTQVSKAQSLLLSGSMPFEVEQVFARWGFKTKNLGTQKLPPKLLEWNNTLCEVTRLASDLGFPISPILKEIGPIVKLEEKLWSKLKNYEKQFAAQIALVLVLPWACATMSGPFPWGVFSFCGACLQILGCGLFYFFVRRALNDKNEEDAFLFELLVQLRIRLLSGVTLGNALEETLARIQATVSDTEKTKNLTHCWQQWQQGLAAFSEELHVEWLKNFTKSQEIAATLQEFAMKGAPCSEPLAHWIEQILDERQSRLELQIGMLPTVLSVVICLFLAPAFFLILGENLWPQISAVVSPSM